MDNMKFCPHCGESLLPIAPAPIVQTVLKREVTTQEVEQFWGSKPLPFQIKPFGVIVNEQKEPIALACEDLEGKHWALSNGETILMGDVGMPQLANSSGHTCSRDSALERAARGSSRYGRG